MTHQNTNDNGCACATGSTSAAEACCRGESAAASQVFTPAVDVLETEHEWLVRADLPGATSETIAINFEDGQLTIDAGVQKRAPHAGAHRHSEYGVGDFRRAFRIGEGIDASRISAEYRDGVLSLRLPKSEGAKPRKIQVQAG